MKYLLMVSKMAEAGNGKVPEWVLLFADGVGELQTGEKYLVDQVSFDLITERIASQGNEVVWDYEHQTVHGGKAPAAGWIKALRYDEGVGIMAKVEWTEEAAGYLARKEYKYFSPVFGVRASDNRVIGLHSVALTNTPKTKNMQPIVAKMVADSSAAQEETIMDLALLIAKLGLPENSTEADVQAKLDELMTNAVQKTDKVEVIAKSVTDALGLPEDEDVTTVVASIYALKQTEKNTVSKADFEALQKQIREREVTEIVAKAMATGKITPDQKAWAEGYANDSLEGFKTFIAKAPQVVPLDKLPKHTKEVDTAEADGVTMTIAKSMGLTAEDIKTYA